MKSILVIGLGRFGRHMAKKFSEQNNDVMAIDINEERINNVLSVVTNALIGDATNEQFMETIGVRDFDLCVVAIGDNFQSSLETTALLKDLGAKFVLARASRDVHAKFLLRNGADDVIYTEKETAERLAVKYGSDNIFNYIELNDEYSIYEIAVPSSWLNKSILKVNVRSKYGISILATKQGNNIFPLPKPEHVFTDSESLMILGKNEDVSRFIK
ncbi:MAG: TrkA family potassium uptake protein [Clostridia bacterium]|jgi:trk system potassium uptake protein TrkA|uniref:potassium channel family protein n=1 Tax=Candidatus Fimenecus sp. TaxID=3022888 RepID=UPI001B435140|nr:TrkA family potassium uptake protein [Clostridia bacterium]